MKNLTKTFQSFFLIASFAFLGSISSFSQWSLGTGVVYTTTSTNRVGIGLSNPSSKLHVTWSASGPITEINRAAISGINTSTDVGYHNAIGVFGQSSTPDGGAIFGYNTVGGFAGYFLGRGYFSGSVGIGCTSFSAKLTVNGTIKASEVEITTLPCSDFVFEKSYNLMPLTELEKYVISNKHLPEIPSAKEFSEGKSYKMGQMDDLLLRKVEEITLYLIELKKENEELKKQIKSLTE